MASGPIGADIDGSLACPRIPSPDRTMPQSKRRKPKHTTPTVSKNPVAASASRSRPDSPTWYVAVMSGLMGAGVLAVLARFVWQMDNWVTGVGLVAIAVGFFMTTNYR